MQPNNPTKLPFLITLLLAIQQVAFGMLPGSSAIETGTIHLNNDAFVSGDIIQYKVFITNGNGNIHEDPSTVVYFDIISPSNEVVAYWRSNARKGMAAGEKPLPNNLTTGVYLFRFYTSWMRNLSLEQIPSKPILIVDISEEQPAELQVRADIAEWTQHYLGKLETLDTIKDSPASTPISTNQEVEPAFKISASNISKGSRGSVTISIPNGSDIESAKLSVSVSESTYRDAHNAPVPVVYPLEGTDYSTNGNTSIRSENIKEVDFYALKGRVLNSKTNEPYSNREVFLSYTDSVAFIKYSITGPNGQFCFLLDSLYDNRNLVLQVYDPTQEMENVTWEVATKVLAPPQPNSPTVSIPLDSAFAQRVEEMRKRSLMDRIYNPISTPENSPPLPRKLNFYVTPSYTLNPSEYFSMVDFTDMSENLLPGVRFRMRRGEYQISVVDTEKQIVNNEDILVMLDGHPFFNLEFISSLSSREVDRVDVLYGTFMYGNLTFNGLVSIFTKAGIGLSTSIFKSPIHIFNNNLQNARHELLLKNGHDRSTINTSILWEPEVAIHKSEPATIQTPSIAFEGSYIVEVTGVTNCGRVINQWVPLIVE